MRDGCWPRVVAPLVCCIISSEFEVLALLGDEAGGGVDLAGAGAGDVPLRPIENTVDVLVSR